LILIGHSQFAHQTMFRQMKEKLISRTYLALVEGKVESDSGRIDLPIARPADNSRRRVIDPAGQPAVTNYRVIKKWPAYTLLQLQLETGRTHQIRVHLSAWGTRFAGTVLYGNYSDLISRQLCTPAA
jgi:23S rRNA pseudouridine1911/1915/1917 synthase